jgi:hypothetical protein
VSDLSLVGIERSRRAPLERDRPERGHGQRRNANQERSTRQRDRRRDDQPHEDHHCHASEEEATEHVGLLRLNECLKLFCGVHDPRISGTTLRSP